MIVDIHTHAYPDDISVKAIENMERIFGLDSFCGGSIKELLSAMDKAGVDISVLQEVALNPHQVISINTWMGSVQSKRIKCFAAMHPDLGGFADEIERIKEFGFWGVKFQPEFQDFQGQPPPIQR